MDINVPEQWNGDIPVFLLVFSDNLPKIIDLDERGWLDKHSDIFERRAATWHLVEKASGRVWFTLVVSEGEKPYYLARHFARFSANEGEEHKTTAYGIGKKRLDGHTDRLWVFYPTGQICTGDDVDILGQAALAQM